MRMRLTVVVLLLVATGACSNDHRASPGTGSEATTSSTVAGRSGNNAPADQTDASSTTSSSGPAARAGATGSGGQPATGVTGVRSGSTTSSEPYTQR
jgi:hypothetical protein